MENVRTVYKLAVDKLVSPQSRQYDQIAFHYFVQYHLYRIKKIVLYAHRKRIVKGDIPIGVYRYSCDAWVSPEFTFDGRRRTARSCYQRDKTGIPTYNWERDWPRFFPVVKTDSPNGELF
jgi:4-alpha-glucanotransferase